MIMINIFDQSLIIIICFQTKKLKEMFWLVLKKYSEKGTIKTCLTCQNMHVYIHFHNKNQTIFQILLLNIQLKCIKHFFLLQENKFYLLCQKKVINNGAFYFSVYKIFFKINFEKVHIWFQKFQLHFCLLCVFN